MVFGKFFHKGGGTENIKMLTELFVKIHHSICETLSEAAQCGPTFKAASRFEVGMYLLFRLDREMCNKQEVDVRAELVDTCTGTLLPSDEPRLWNIADHRLKRYGEIFNETKNSGGDWGDAWQRCHEWLVNAIYYCGDKYEKMTTEAMPFVVGGATQKFFINTSLVSCELCTITMFCCALKHVFSDNNNFTLLSKKEVSKRVETGLKEGLAIADKHSK
ncbi:hypothetical protein ES703_48839 [subsurface metagenome]